jgi:hypothetical protein
MSLCRYYVQKWDYTQSYDIDKYQLTREIYIYIYIYIVYIAPIGNDWLYLPLSTPLSGKTEWRVAHSSPTNL